MHTWATNARHISSMQNAVPTPIEQPITADLRIEKNEYTINARVRDVYVTSYPTTRTIFWLTKLKPLKPAPPETPYRESTATARQVLLQLFQGVYSGLYVVKIGDDEGVVRKVGGMRTSGEFSVHVIFSTVSK